MKTYTYPRGKLTQGIETDINNAIDDIINGHKVRLPQHRTRDDIRQFASFLAAIGYLLPRQTPDPYNPPRPTRAPVYSLKRIEKKLARMKPEHRQVEQEALRAAMRLYFCPTAYRNVNENGYYEHPWDYKCTEAEALEVVVNLQKYSGIDVICPAYSYKHDALEITLTYNPHEHKRMLATRWLRKMGAMK